MSEEESQSSAAPTSHPEEIEVKNTPSTNLYGNIPGMPSIDAVDGIKFDFCSGLRILFPKGDKRYHLKFYDDDSGLLMYDSDVKPGTIITSV